MYPCYIALEENIHLLGAYYRLCNLHTQSHLILIVYTLYRRYNYPISRVRKLRLREVRKWV